MPDRPTPDTILQEALELTDSQERAAYLDEACGKDAALRDEIESLLAAYFDADAFMDTLAVPVWRETASEKEGDRIGRYKLLQPIGEGGFGTVYLAEQTEPVKRRVALKVIKAGMDSKEVIARFEAERQALALMDHPHIAKVHDAGTTEGGRPYFVMELVKGVPLTKYCADKDLDTKARLELFMDVCAAVQHAHQKGIIHRDLKPSNILVSPHDGKPVVKVIDFGIAKAISMELTEKTVFTQLGRMIGTPQYMSPEQAELNALDVDTRSDIYSLGVVLYELLTGTTPLDGEQLRSAAYGEMQRLIREETPPKPSTRVSTVARQVSTCHTPDSRSLRGDLDWIVMKALEKDRERRYETANGFAADVRRFLNQEPVSAGPPGMAYKMGKFVRRNRTTVAVAATIIFLLVAGIFGTSWFAVSSHEAQKKELAAKEVAVAGKEETKAALKKSRYEEARSWLERARLYQTQKNDFAASMMAAKALGFRGFGAERQSEEFRQEHPVLLDQEKPEFEELMKFAKRGSSLSRLIWQAPISEPQSSCVTSCAFSPDGITLAGVTGVGSTIKLWDLASGAEIRSFDSSHDYVSSIAFSPDGTILAGGGESYRINAEGLNSVKSSIKLWDITTGKETRSLQGLEDQVTSIAFSPDGATLASGGGMTIRFWNVSTGQEIPSLRRDQLNPRNVTFSSDGSTLASGSFDGLVKVWDIATREPRISLGGANDYYICVAFSPDGTTLATGSYLKTLKLWDIATGNEIRSLEGHQGPVYGVAFSPDGSTLASGGTDGTTTLWDVATGKEIQSLGGQREKLYPYPFFPYGGESATGSVVFSPDGTTIASGSRRETIKLWNVSTGKEIQTLQGHEDLIRSVAFSPDGASLASGGNDMSVKLWDTRTGKELRTFDGHGAPVSSIAFSPTGTILASGSEDKTIKLWNVSTGEETRSLKGHQGRVFGVAFSPDRTTLASGSEDKTIKLWNVSTGEEIRSFPGDQDTVDCMAFSPNGAILASGGLDGPVRFWDVNSGKVIRSLGEESDQVLSLAFSPDGTILAATEPDGVTLWSVSTGRGILSFDGHEDLFEWSAFSPDGSTLASGMDNTTIKFWDVATGKELRSLQGHQGGIYSVAFSPDGSTLASGGGGVDGTIKLWPISTSPLDVADYLDPRNPWCQLDGSKILWTTPSPTTDNDLEFEFLNVLPFSNVGILRSVRTQEEKNRDLFWNCLHAENWNSARVLYGRLKDPATKEIAREMTVRKRATKAQTAFDRGRYHHARWHLLEITSLLKAEETDPAMLKAKETIGRLKANLDKLPQ